MALRKLLLLCKRKRVSVGAQVREAEVEAGEEMTLRQRLRQMEARQASVQRCGIVRMGLVGDDGSGGVQEGLRSVQTQLNAVLADEEAYAAVRAGNHTTGHSCLNAQSTPSSYLCRSIEKRHDWIFVLQAAMRRTAGRWLRRRMRGRGWR